MQAAQRFLRLGGLAVALCGLLPGVGQAQLISIESDPGLKGLGHFQGTIDYTDISATHARLVWTLTNTSPADEGGLLKAFAFNNPDGQITDVDLRGPVHFHLMGLPDFDNTIKSNAYGLFDIGVSTSPGFDGSQPQSWGLAPGQTGHFVFNLTGRSLDQLRTMSFLESYSAPQSGWKGKAPLAARFQSFDNHAGGDTVPDFAQGAPEPGTLALAGSALATLFGFGCWRRKEDKA